MLCANHVHVFQLSNSQVEVNDGQQVVPALILGVDNYGFLRIRKKDGSLATVHPDGNSFVLLHGLVVPKF